MTASDYLARTFSRRTRQFPNKNNCTREGARLLYFWAQRGVSTHTWIFLKMVLQQTCYTSTRANVFGHISYVHARLTASAYSYGGHWVWKWPTVTFVSGRESGRIRKSVSNKMMRNYYPPLSHPSNSWLTGMCVRVQVLSKCVHTCGEVWPWNIRCWRGYPPSGYVQTSPCAVRILVLYETQCIE